MQQPMLQQQLIPNALNFNQQAPPQSLIQGRNYPTLYVGNLEEQITEEMLYKFFYRFGNIYSIRVMRDRTMKTSRGFAYVSFYQLKDAEVARTQANHDKILKQELRVTWKKNLKEVNREANIIVKNLDESVTGQNLEQEFSIFGSIFSSIVCYDVNGKSRGYGYVQFDTVESAQNCIKGAQNLKIKEKVVIVQTFQQKQARTDSRKNLYFKNLPTQAQHSKDQVKAQLDAICKVFGEIESSVVELSQTTQKYFAFVSFKEKDAAENCLRDLRETDPFKINEQLYVVWHESKTARQKILIQQYKNSSNETNLYTKFLKQEVTQEELKKQFQKYGEISSCVIRKPDPNSAYAQKNPEKVYNTNFGYINFSDKENAKKAIEDAKNDSEIKKLYDKSVYLTFLIKKDQFNNFKDAKFRHKKGPQFPQFILDPFMNPFMFNQFNPQLMGKQNQFGGMRPPFQQGFNPMMGMVNPLMQQQFPGVPQQNPQQRQQFQNQNKQNFGIQQQRQGQNQFKNKPQQHQVRPQPQANKNQYRPGAQGQNFGNQRNLAQGALPQSVQQQAEFKYTSQNLKENLAKFLQLSKDEQRTILGELLYPSVLKCSQQSDLAPKITGMLIDFEVFEIQEIIEFLESEENLKERVLEAEELIKQGDAQA